MSDELKPCPLCGARSYVDRDPFDKSEYRDSWVVVCQWCGLLLPPDSRENNIKRWNTRRHQDYRNWVAIK
jgi:hypothetical protein